MPPGHLLLYYLLFQLLKHSTWMGQYFGDKAKERILKRRQQENKAHQIFQKTKIYYPLIHTRKTFSQHEKKG